MSKNGARRRAGNTSGHEEAEIRNFEKLELSMPPRKK
jgi:hypothetical protein